MTSVTKIGWVELYTTLWDEWKNIFPDTDKGCFTRSLYIKEYGSLSSVKNILLNFRLRKKEIKIKNVVQKWNSSKQFLYTNLCVVNCIKIKSSIF